MYLGERAIAYTFDKDFEHAIDDYNKLIKQNPNDSRTYYNRAIVFYGMAKYDKAVSDLNKAINLGFKKSKVFAKLGESYLKERKPLEALLNLNNAIKVDPNEGSYYYKRSVVYYVLKEYGNALRDVYKAQELGSVIDSKFTNFLEYNGPKNLDH